MSTVDCERGFSALSHIKTYLHNRLSNRILNDLMTTSIKKQLKIARLSRDGVKRRTSNNLGKSAFL